MFDVALANAGSQVVLSTSCDEKYPPENIIDGKNDTFWVSTGMIPQELVITFQALMNISSVSIVCYNVKKLCLERSVQNEPRDFEPLEEKELENSDGQLQMEEISLNNTTAQHLRLNIKGAYDQFVAIYKVSVDGSAVHG